MRQRSTLSLLILFIGLALVPVQNPPAAADPLFQEIAPLTKSDRILILAPHPDDESIACSAAIQKAVKNRADIRVVYLTNGEHNQLAFIVYEKRIPFKQKEFIHLGQVRRQESIRAMQLLGLSPEQLIFLGYPDFGTFIIFNQYWGEGKPFKDALTRISSVPYQENLSFGAPYKGENILADLEKILLDFKPNKIFVSHPADVNVDHRALYLFLEVALADLEKKIPLPQVYPYLVHYLDWPLPRHYHPELPLEPPEKFLHSQIRWMEMGLSRQQVEKKYQTILCYKSQTESSAFYLFSFARKNELFGSYPRFSLSSPTASPQDRQAKISYSKEEGDFCIHIQKAAELEKRLSFILYIFGYSDETPFARMPKIRIVARYRRLKVFAQGKLIKAEDIFLEERDSEFILRIPFKILGKPNFVLTGMRTGNKALPAEATIFRRIDI